ncbi:MAG: sulfotransferase family 2 domain-containing protein [Paracoccaceae bacterium]
MIISRGRRYIFVHIPKTGGTSLSLALEARAMKDDILIGDTPKALRRRARVKQLQGSGRLWKHSGIADIHGVVSDADLADFFIVTLVRNPWDRMVSYYYWLKLQKFDHPAVSLARTLGFGDFLRAEHVQKSISSAPYSSYVTDNSGNLCCNLFARIEHLHDDLAPFEKHIGFSLGTIERVNTSPRETDFRQYFSDDDAEIVAKICAEDIERFGYRFAAAPTVANST